MKKKVVLLAMGCALVMAGCSGAEITVTTTDNAAQSTSEEAPAAEATEAASEEAAAEDVYEVDLGEEITPDADGKVSNGTISIQMPADAAGTYLAYNYNGDINIYDKESAEGGFGGFIFGVCMTDDYAQYGGMRTKIGELTDADGKLYHVLISYPSDVQWDYTKGEEAPASYKAIYDKAREIAATLQSENGGTYVDGAGTKGEDIYGDYLKDVVAKIESAKDSNELEAEDLSPVYYAMTQGADPKDPLKDCGVAFIDFNLDGVDEMVIGDIESKEIYDIFGSVDGKPAHAVSGNWRDYYKLYGSVLAEYTTEGADVSVINTYDLLPNSTEMFPQYSLKLDETEAAENKWSVSYDEGSTWEALTEEDYKMRLSNIEDFTNDKELKFTALGDFK